MAVDIQFNVDQALAKLGELVAKHGPQAIDLAAQVVQVNAVGTLVTGAVLAVLAVATATVAMRSLAPRWRRGHAAWRAYMDDRTGHVRSPADDGMGWGAATFVVGLITAALIAATLNCLVDVWAWVALFNPKLALAHQLLAKFAGI